MCSFFPARVCFSAPDLRKRVDLSHDAQDGFDVDADMELLFDPGLDTAATVGIIALLLAGPDLLDELTVSVCFMLLLSPGIIPAAGDFQKSAE